MYKFNFICIIAVAFNMQCADTQKTGSVISCTIAELLSNTSAMLAKNVDACKAFKSAMSSVPSNSTQEGMKTYWAALQAQLEECEAKNPIFLLSECMAMNCILTRSRLSIFRDEFEKRVSDEFIAKSNTTENGMRYVSFAGGELFSDFVIMSKILSQKPTQKVTMCVIDSCLKEYMRARCLHKLGASIEPQEAFSIGSMKVRGFKGKEKSFVAHARLHQFITSLRSGFPKAQFSLYAYSSIHTYLEEVPSKEECFIVGADFNEIGLFTQLLGKSLEHNRNTTAFALLRTCGPSGVFVCISQWHKANQDNQIATPLNAWEIRPLKTAERKD